MKVKVANLDAFFHIFMLSVHFPTFFSISFNFLITAESDGEGKCLKSNPTEAWQTDFHLLYSKNLFTLNVFLQIGAASKGIIQRDFQHHATVFKSPYAKNPFDSVSNDELEEYKRIIDKKQRGETSPVIEDPGDTTDPGIFSIQLFLNPCPFTDLDNFPANHFSFRSISFHFWVIFIQSFLIPYHFTVVINDLISLSFKSLESVESNL